MKKILLTFSLLAMLITVACDTTKNNVVTTAAPQPPSTPTKPQKGEMKESDMKPMQVVPYEKKAFAKKGGLQPMEAVIVADSVVPKN